MLTTIEDVPVLDLTTAKIIGDALFEHYPKWLWAIHVRDDGIAEIRNLNLSGHWHFDLDAKASHSASDLKTLSVRAGGEILERFRVARSKDAGLSKLEVLARDLSGNFRPDL